MTSLSMTLEPLRTTPPETVFVRQITGELDEKYFIVTAYDSGSGSLDRRRGNSGTALLATQLVRGLVGAARGWPRHRSDRAPTKPTTNTVYEFEIESAEAPKSIIVRASDQKWLEAAELYSADDECGDSGQNRPLAQLFAETQWGRRSPTGETPHLVLEESETGYIAELSFDPAGEKPVGFNRIENYLDGGNAVPEEPGESDSKDTCRLLAVHPKLLAPGVEFRSVPRR
jgi:hypothetical protein